MTELTFQCLPALFGDQEGTYTLEDQGLHKASQKCAASELQGPVVKVGGELDRAPCLVSWAAVGRARSV